MKLFIINFIFIYKFLLLILLYLFLLFTIFTMRVLFSDNDFKKYRQLFFILLLDQYEMDSFIWYKNYWVLFNLLLSIKTLKQ